MSFLQNFFAYKTLPLIKPKSFDSIYWHVLTLRKKKEANVKGTSGLLFITFLRGSLRKYSISVLSKIASRFWTFILNWGDYTC